MGFCEFAHRYVSVFGNLLIDKYIDFDICLVSNCLKYIVSYKCIFLFLQIFIVTSI